MKKLWLALLMSAALSACSPQYDWRDYRSNDAPYAVLFPSKPATQTRSVKLDNLDVDMTMTAAEVDGVVFAVGSAQLADAARTPAALEAMKAALSTTSAPPSPKRRPPPPARRRCSMSRPRATATASRWY